MEARNRAAAAAFFCSNNEFHNISFPISFPPQVTEGEREAFPGQPMRSSLCTDVTATHSVSKGCSTLLPLSLD